MGDYLIPVLLTICVALPGAVAAVVFLAASSVGQALGAPPRSRMGWWSYARLLMFPSSSRSDVDWHEFESLLSRVAHGEVRVWDTLGPEPPPADRRPQPRPGSSGGSDEPSWAERTFDDVRPQVSMRAVRWVVGLALGVMVLWLVSGILFASSSSPSGQDGTSPRLQSLAAGLGTGTPWVQAGGNSVQTVIPPEKLVGSVALARLSGMEVVCPAADNPTGSESTAGSAAAAMQPCQGASQNGVEMTVVPRPTGYLVILEDAWSGDSL